MADDSDDDGLWCPQCGVQYRRGFTTCADCRVALAAEPPDFSVSDEHAEPVVYELGDWPPAKRDKLSMLMRGAGIPVVWSDVDALCIPQAREADMDALIDDLEGQDDVAEDEPIGPPPLPDPYASALTIAGRHSCGRALCPFGLELTNDGEVVVSWTEGGAEEGVFVTLADVLAAHADDRAAVIEEHAATLTEAARQAVSRTDPRPDSLAAQVTLENLADFSAELSSWCLADRTDADGRLAWTAATAVMRAMVAMSALTDVIDEDDG